MASNDELRVFKEGTKDNIKYGNENKVEHFLSEISKKMDSIVQQQSIRITTLRDLKQILKDKICVEVIYNYV